MTDQKTRPSKSILHTFYGLASFDDAGRKRATLLLMNNLEKEKAASKYCLERLVKGLASPRENARLGFAVALTEILKSNHSIQCDHILEEMDKHLPIKGAGENAKNNAIGQLLCILALIRSGKCKQAIDKIMERLNGLIADRSYLELFWAQAIISLTEMADDEEFRNSVWPSLKSVINVGLDNCSAAVLWIILELDKSHQKYLRKKTKLFRDGNWPPTDENGYMKIGEILATGIRSTPSGFHPLEKTLLSAMVTGDNLDAFWNHTVTGYLLVNDNKLVSSVGIRMIGNTLQMTPSKKQVKHVLSNDTLKQLLKALLNRQPAARFARSAAWEQMEAIQKFVADNKANPAIQFLVLKKIIDFSINFDSVSGSTLLHGLIGQLSTEAASMASKELITRWNGQRSNDNERQLQTSETLTAIKLLVRIFECSKFANADILDYQRTILQLLAFGAFMKPEFTDLPSELSAQPNSEFIANAFMRCLDALCVVTSAQRGNKPKFELPQKSASIMKELMDVLVDRKRRRLSEKCKASLKPEHEKLAVKAASTYCQLLKSFDTETNADKEKGFAILVGYSLFWFINDPNDYAQALEDIMKCYENSQEATPVDSEPSWMDVLMDTLLELLSRPYRHIRTPIQVAFHYFCPLLRLENIRPLLQALKPSETENLLMEGGQEAGEHDDASNENEGGHEDDAWTSSGEESEADEEEEENASGADDGGVDPEFRRAVEDVLGEAAIHSDTESTASDLTDEAMLKFDESLAAVFRSHLSGATAKKSSRDLAEQVQAFRVRCFDLVFVLLQSEPSAEVLTGILLPILNVANESVRISDQKNVFHRARQVTERVVQMKQLPSVPGNTWNEHSTSLLQLIKSVIEFTRDGCSNPSVQLLASEIIRFLLKFGDDNAPERKKSAFEAQIKDVFASYLEAYLKDRSCLTPTCIFTAAFQKRPRLFLENLPTLIDCVFAEDVRPFRRREACGLVHCLLNKDALTIIKDKTDKKTNSAWKRFIERLHDRTLEMIEKSDAAATSDNEPSAVDAGQAANKSVDLFEVLSIVRALANLRHVVSAEKLQEPNFLDALEKFSTSKLAKKPLKGGKARKRMKPSSVCSDILKKLRQSSTAKTNGVAENEELSSSASPTKKRRREN